MLRKLVIMVGFAAVLAIALVTAQSAGQPPNWMHSAIAPAVQETNQAQATTAAQTAPRTFGGPSDLPAFHDKEPKDPLPQTLDPLLFPDPVNQNVYALAAREKKILYQQPCYCRCDREVGHKSLLDCYVDRHASVCATCKMEAVFAYQEMKKGKTAAQIRQEIIDGKWRNVDMSSYTTPGAVSRDSK